MDAIADREAVSTSVSASGYKGGTYTVNDGAMYFIGSTCGHKRYWPYSKEDMEEDFSAHKVENYFDLFTGMFAQPDKPSFSVFSVKDQTITIDSYTADAEGNATPLNTFKVVRTKEHTLLTGVENVRIEDIPQVDGTAKILHNGQILIIRGNEVFNTLGQMVK